jgi:MFS family permease
LVGRIRRREPRPGHAPDAHLGKEIAEGLRFVFGNRLLRAIATSAATFNFFSGITSAMLIVLLAGVLHLRAGTIGVYYSVAALGGLAGALVATRVAARLGQGPAILLSLLASGVSGMVVPLARSGWPLWGVAVGFALSYAANVVYNVTQLSFRQGLTPERLLGRMNATMRFLVWGTMPLGGLAGGVLGQLFGARTALWVAAAGGLLAFLPVVLSPLPTMRELPTGGEPEQVATPVRSGGT